MGAVSCMPFRFLFGVFRILSRTENQINAEQYSADSYKEIGNVEHLNEFYRLNDEHIHHIAVHDPVDTVSYGAGSGQYRRPAAKAAFYHVLCQRQNYHRREHHRQQNEYPPPAGQQTESRAFVMDVHQLEHARYQFYGAGIQRYVGRDPVFHPLVGYQRQHSHYRIQHIY